MCTKLSICFVYFNVFKRANSRLIRATRVVTVFTALLVVGYYFAAFLVSIFQCTPVSKSWYPKVSGTCIYLDRFRNYTAAINIITSVLVIVTPLPALSKMRQNRPEITELMGLILLGLAHTACTIARLVLMFYPDPATKSDSQWTSITPLSIAIVEMDVGIVAASLIVMRPCFYTISNTVTKRSQMLTSFFTKSDPQRTSLSISGAPPNEGIVRTTEFEMEIQPTSVREATPKDMF